MSRIVVLRNTPAEPLGEHVLALHDLGYDVHVVAPGDEPEPFTEVVDGVTVTTIRVQRWLASGSRMNRSARWTRPLGYRLMVRGTVRLAAAKARITEAEFQRDVALVRSGSVPAPLRARLTLARAERRWVSARLAHTKEAYDLRRKGRRRVDVVSRRWWRTSLRKHAWARLDPALLDPEIHLGPLLDEIDADAILAEGAVMMSVAVRSAARRGRPVPVIWDTVDEFKPKRPWVAEARTLLVAEYGHRAGHTLKAHTPEALAAVCANAGLAPSTSTSEGTP